MKPKLKKGQIVEVIWTDTHIPENPSWMTEKEHHAWAADCGSSVRSVGVFISEDKNFINLVGDLDSDDVSEISVLRPINIAKGFIKELYILKRAK